MEYSAKDMMVASRIAYYDIDQDLLAAYDYQLSLREVLRMSPHIQEELEQTLADADSDMQRARAEEALNIYKEILEPDSKYGDWIIRKVRDTNAETGFYGCLIETGEDQAIVGFRGSEDASDSGNLINDWIKADIGLTNSTLTQQQLEAQQFMKNVAYTTDYKEYALTGHSLGGNLAFHATIMAPAAIRSKIIQSVSLDGPGFSNEYLQKYAGRINSVSKVMVHYQWSLVGAIFHQPSGVRNQSVQVQEYGDASFSFFRHDMGFVNVDEKGEFIDGKTDTAASIVKAISSAMDAAPSLFFVPLTVVSDMLNAEGISASMIKSIPEYVTEVCSNIWAVSNQGFVHAQFSIDVQIAQQVMDQVHLMQRKMNGFEYRLSEIRKNTIYLKVTSLPLRLTIFYLEGKVRQSTEELGLYREAGNRIISAYRKIEKSNIDRFVG